MSVCRQSCGFPVFFAIAGLFAVYAPQTLSAEESDDRPRAVVEHYAEGKTAEDLEGILVRAVEIELRRDGLKARPGDVSREAGVQPPSEEYLLEHAAEVNGELLLAGTYALSERSLELHYRMIDVKRQEVLAEGVREDEVDLVLDRMVTDLLRDLLRQSEERVSELRQQRAEIARSQTPEPRREAPEEPPPQPTSAGVEQPTRRLELSVCGTAVISVGEFAPYLPYGYTTTSALLVWLGEGDVRFGLGGRAGYQHMFPAEEGLAGFVRSFVPLGVDMHVSAWDSNPLSLRLSVSGGAAMRISDGSTVSERLAAAIPYASAGVGGDIALGERFAIGVEAAMRSLFHIYRENGESEPQVEPITGFSPGLSLHYQL